MLASGSREIAYFSNDVNKTTVILSVCFFGMICSLFLFGILDPSDGYYSEASREMLRRGDFGTPYLYYKPFYEKPIGLYWMVLACYEAFGVHEFAARLPSALSGILCSVFVAKVLSDLNLKRVGLLSAIVMVGTPLYAIVARLCLTDMPFSANLSIAILSFFAYSSGLKRHYLWFGYLALGLAFLMKGPVAIVLCGIITFTHLIVLSTGKDRKFSRNKPGAKWWQNLLGQISYLNPLIGIAIIVAINLPWYLFESMHTNGAFVQEFFVRQHLGRAAGHVNHQEPWYFYIPVLLAGTVPWSLFLSGFASPKRQIFQRTSIRADLAKLCLIWMVAIVGIFTASVAKLPTYVVPAMVPFAIFVALSLEYLIRSNKLRTLQLIALTTTIVTLIGSIAMCFIHGIWHGKLDCAAVAISLLGFLAGSIFPYQKKMSANRAAWVMCACYAFSTTAGIAAMLHAYDKVKSAPMRNMYLTASKSGGSAACFVRPTPSALFYAERPVSMLQSKTDYFNYLRDTPAPHFVITTKDVESLTTLVCPGVVKVKEQENYCLFAANDFHEK
ncbi:MAG TPA: glycosyltransferase family 39 protein [Drouetiella sp.]